VKILQKFLGGLLFTALQNADAV